MRTWRSKINLSKYERLQPRELLQGVQSASECIHIKNNICLRNEKKKRIVKIIIEKFNSTEI
jgi:hypothetical protein